VIDDHNDANVDGAREDRGTLHRALEHRQPLTERHERHRSVSAAEQRGIESTTKAASMSYPLRN
jgi:hypothetical protein